MPGEVVERLEYELGVISDMGFSAYFLVVWDLIHHAKSNGIRVGPGPGQRGGLHASPTACASSTSTRSATTCIFERFLNPGRKSMPDIDMDFDERYRGEMIRYAADKYGWDHVAQIVTFSTIKARAAVRDAARVLGYPYAVGDKIAKAMPPLDHGPRHAAARVPRARPEATTTATRWRPSCATCTTLDPDAKQVIDVARGLEGLRRQDGIHAAAVVITREPLTEYLPIQRKPEPGGTVDDAPIVTQYEMHGVEELGLLKMDFLGLRNLDVIELTLDLIEALQRRAARHRQRPARRREDARRCCARATRSACSSSRAGRCARSCARWRRRSFDDVAALVALYRPGPMAANMHNDYADRKNGRKPITYLHPDLEEVLGDTQGLMIYQESLMRVAQKFAGYSLEEADNLRKACGKKMRELMAKERDEVRRRLRAHGLRRASSAPQLFDIIEPFADYAFNKSHAYGYGFIAYQTAWLKAHHPVEYLAALLTLVKDDKDKTAVYLAECRSARHPGARPRRQRVGVGLRRPSTRTIPFGLSAVRNVGEGLVGHIVGERETNGPFVDFYDFCERVDPMVLNKRTVESLIKGGAFDSLGHPRKGLLPGVRADRRPHPRRAGARRPRASSTCSAIGARRPACRRRSSGRRSPTSSSTRRQRLAFEKEMLGLYVSDHPLMGAERALAPPHRLPRIAELRELARRARCAVVGGVVTALSAQVHQAGRADGHVRARRPRRRPSR